MFKFNRSCFLFPIVVIVVDAGQICLSADVLYLRAFEGGLSSVCDSTHITESVVDGTLISRLNGKNHDPDFRWNVGYRIGIGYEFADSDCGIGAYWTHSIQIPIAAIIIMDIAGKSILMLWMFYMAANVNVVRALSGSRMLV